MAFVFTWAGALGVVASLAALALATVVYWTRPDRSQNRRLALMLFVEGLGFLGGTGAMYLTDTAATAWAWQAVTIVFITATPSAYLLFLATLDTPLANPLRHPIVERGLLLGLVLSPLPWFLSPATFVQGMSPGKYAPWDSVLGPGFIWGILGIVLASLVGLILAVSVWRRSEPGTARRSQARSYALAFGARDVGLPLTFVLFLLHSMGIGGEGLQFAAGVVLPASILLVFVLLLAYGILKTQLFDIDLKLKWTLEKSTVAGVFIAVFFIVSEAAQVLFAGFAGSELLGVFAAGGLVFFLAPLQRFADRVADTAMPGVEDTEAYREHRARELYRAAVESGLEDGVITDRERDMLARLQDELNLTGQVVLELEREVRDAQEGTG